MSSKKSRRQPGERHDFYTPDVFVRLTGLAVLVSVSVGPVYVNIIASLLGVPLNVSSIDSIA